MYIVDDYSDGSITIYQEKKMNYKETAKGILEHVGGVENISNMSHCACLLYTSDAADE